MDIGHEQLIDRHLYTMNCDTKRMTHLKSDEKTYTLFGSFFFGF